MSTLNVDALVGNTSANAITVRGEGSATTSLQQGLCKAWVNFNGTGTVAIRDSHNVGSITDRATGAYSVIFSNSMANVNYAVTTATNRASDWADGGIDVFGHAVGQIEVDNREATAGTDTPIFNVIVNGDLA